MQPDSLSGPHTSHSLGPKLRHSQLRLGRPLKAGQGAQIPGPPTRVVPPLTTNPLGHAPDAPVGMVGHPKGTQKDGGRGSRGSVSPLMRAFALPASARRTVHHLD
jgi:hypothetical protein